jgi:hypothetical protein
MNKAITKTITSSLFVFDGKPPYFKAEYGIYLMRMTFLFSRHQ